MADLTLAERQPLAHAIVAGRHGRESGEPAVRLRARHGLTVTALLARNGRQADLRQAVGAAGLALPEPGRSVSRDGCSILWSGPGQWTVLVEPGRAAALAPLLGTPVAVALVVDQSDARAVIEVAGPGARATLAKGFPVDLHPRVFGPGSTAVTAAAGVPAQIWLIDDAPTFGIAVPLSLSEGFWHWLTHAAAEFGSLVEA